MTALPNTPGALLGYTRSGRPIYLAAGGSEDDQQGDGQSDDSQQGDSTEEQTEQADATDWKAEARKHEKRAKENARAAADLKKLQASQMSEQEKAVTEAKAQGSAEAAKTYGTRLAEAKLEAAAATAKVDLSEVAEFLDLTKFVTDDGDVDGAAIKAAVGKFAKLAPGKARSGGDFGGAPTPPAVSLEEQIANATKSRDFGRVISLKRQAAAQNT